MRAGSEAESVFCGSVKRDAFMSLTHSVVSYIHPDKRVLAAGRRLPDQKPEARAAPSSRLRQLTEREGFGPVAPDGWGCVTAALTLPVPVML